MTNLSAPPQHPLEVKPVPTWRSIDRQFLGWFPGIFGTREGFPTPHFMLPAVPRIDPFDTLDADLWETPEACMAAWEKSVPVPLVAHGVPGTKVIQTINNQQLFRDPLLLTAENPFEDEGVERGLEPLEELADE